MIERISEGLVQGYLHLPEGEYDTAAVLAHGAGSDCNSRLLVAVAAAFAARGVLALRVNLPFRHERRTGPPHLSGAARDREALRAASSFVRRPGVSTVILGGHSYGGRQASMLAAEDPSIADRLLLISYPLHPPRKPDQLRTAHFPALRTPAVFVHGTRDPFGSPEEMRAALPAGARLILIEGAGHEQKPLLSRQEVVMEAIL
jgi:predicted alpha/beta-hydrolase family hydrolase